MAYPPSLPPTNRTDATLSADNHATDHNRTAAALRDLVDELGANPSGTYADLSTRLAALAPTSVQATATVYTAELAARMSIRPTRARRSLMSALFTELITAGVLDKLDGLYLLAAPTEQAARLNWTGMLPDLTAINSPAFVPDRGYTGDGTTSYLAASGVGANALERFKQDDATVGSWARTDVSSSTAYDVSVGSNGYVNPRSGSNAVVRINSSAVATVTLPSASSIGFTSASRRASDKFTVYRNGAPIGTPSVTSTAPSATGVYIGSGPGSSFSTRQIAAAVIGGGLTDAEMLALYTAINNYLTAVGAA